MSRVSKTDCTVEGCARGGRIVRDLCLMHWARMNSNGTTELPPTRTLAERLAARLVEKPNGCIEWTGCISSAGYGNIKVSNKAALTHRIAWELANGPVLDGLFVLHRCDNPPCCNVGHLFLGTNADNMADMAAKMRANNGQSAKTHCPAGHEYDAANTYVNPSNSRRYCKACALAAQRRYAAARNEIAS